jgi:[heparan sulfate]-glucosamine 3-sulfotransferase 5
MIVIILLICFLNIDTSHNEVQSKHLPQAIIIGVKKCGTRALLKFMSIHSAIAASSREIHFFDKQANFQRGLDWYR